MSGKEQGDQPKVEDLPEVEAGAGIDLNEFEGLRKTIDTMEVIDVETSYDEAGNFQEDLKRKVKVLRVVTEEVTEVENKEGEKIPIRASELFNLKLNDENEWGISTSEKAKIQIFMKRQKVSKPSDLKGTSVTLRAYENKQGNTYLGFIVK